MQHSTGKEVIPMRVKTQVKAGFDLEDYVG